MDERSIEDELKSSEAEIHLHTARAKAIKDFLTVRGRLVKVSRITAFNPKDLVPQNEDFEFDLRLNPPAVVRISEDTSLEELLLDREVGSIEPEWFVTLAEPHPQIDPDKYDMEIFKVFATSYNVLTGEAIENSSDWEPVDTDDVLDVDQIKTLASRPNRLTIDEIRLILGNIKEIHRLFREYVGRVAKDDYIAQCCTTLIRKVPPNIVIEDGQAFCITNPSHTKTNFVSRTTQRSAAVYPDQLGNWSLCVLDGIDDDWTDHCRYKEKFVSVFPTREDAEAQGRQWVKTATATDCDGKIITPNDLTRLKYDTDQ